MPITRLLMIVIFDAYTLLPMVNLSPPTSPKTLSPIYTFFDNEIHKFLQESGIIVYKS